MLIKQPNNLYLVCDAAEAVREWNLSEPEVYAYYQNTLELSKVAARTAIELANEEQGYSSFLASLRLRGWTEQAITLFRETTSTQKHERRAA